MKIYKIFYDESIVDLEEKINKGIKQGYVCVGGIAIDPSYSDETHSVFYQAMTLDISL